MDTHEYKLNGLNDEDLLPPIYPNTENDFIRVNSTASAYELTSPDSGLVPVPQATKFLLNSTGLNTYAWRDQAEVPKLTLDGGASAGLYYTNGCNIIGDINDIKIRNNSTDRIICTTSGVDLKGGVSVDSLVVCPTGSSAGLGISGQSTRIDFSNFIVNLRVNGTVRLQAQNNAVNITGNLTQTSNSGNSNTSSGTTTHTGLFRIDKGTLANALEIISGDVVSTSNNTNITSTAGLASMGTFKANDSGTSVLCTYRLVQDNTGIYQSAVNNIDFVSNGTNALNINSNRVQNNIPLSFSKCPAYGSGIYTIAQSNNIVTTTQPLLIAQTPTTGNLDFDFGTASSYFSGQQFQIIVRNVGAGTARYRAQSTTYHVTGGAPIVTISSNTYHTLVNDRYHILICNVDSNVFYLIQT